ncbi:hypothetical protein MLD38_024228 [Melastoma candidum]|uniref:Uncharacterized protein n=1 Tax=Melastoma candidum TaxID=119954 RepID=A0ACB9NRP0_9MYRT|nr:hypothetical protein MLD38_024228 [Melastoma candidum]
MESNESFLPGAVSATTREASLLPLSPSLQIGRDLLVMDGDEELEGILKGDYAAPVLASQGSSQNDDLFHSFSTSIDQVLLSFFFQILRRSLPTYIRFLVSNAAAGSVTGKGGSTITDFQSQSGARIQLSRNHEFFLGHPVFWWN